MNSLALGVIPEQLTPLTLLHLVNTIDQLHVCPGNPDNKFVDMVTSKKGVIKSVVNTAWILPAAPVICNGKLFLSTVRRCDCQILTMDIWCAACKTYRYSLRKMCQRTSDHSSSPVTDTTRHANAKYMTTPEKKEKISKMKRHVSVAEREVAKLQKQIETLTQECGETVDGELQEDLLSIMYNNNNNIREAYPEGSFR